MGFPADVRQAEVNGTALAYVERGAGECVVFVHGTSQDLRTWLSQIDVFAAKYRTIVYSRRYARPNEDIPDGVDDPMDPHVEDLRAMLGKLGAAPAHLVGNSSGGFICLLAAMRHPEMVRSVVLCEPPALPLFISNRPVPSELIKLFVRRPVDAYRIARFGLTVMEPTAKAYRAGDFERGGEIFGKALLGRDSYAAMPEHRRTMLEENTRAEVAQFLGAGPPPLQASDIQRVSAPALLVTGEKSAPVLRKTVTHELKRRCQMRNMSRPGGRRT